MAFRLDRGKLRSPRKTPQGHLRVDGYASRVGIFEYTNPDGTTRRELRLPEEVFRDDALEGFEGAPFTDDHPASPVTPETAQGVTVGYVMGPARRDGDFVAVSALVTNPAVVDKMVYGKRELSVGYQVDLDETPGNHPQWGRYDAIQRNIVVNHLALVDIARAGPEARVRLDASESSCYSDDASGVPTLTGTQMDELKKQLDAALADAAQQKARADQAEKDRDAARSEAQSQRARADQAEKDRDGETKKRTDAEASFDTRVSARVQLIAEAAPILGAEFKFDGKSDDEIRRAVIKADGDDVAADAHPAYVSGMYQGAIKRLGNAQADSALDPLSALVPARADTVAVRADDAEIDENAAARRMYEHSAKLWQTEAK